MAELAVTVDRLALRLTLPYGLDDPGGARDRVTRIVERDLAAACAGDLVAAPDDEAIYRIRQLYLQLWINLQGMTDDEIAGRAGRLLARAIEQALRRAESGPVVRFESARHFVTAFLRDLVDRVAWGRWYYAELLPLRALPPEETALTLLTSRPAWIVPILTDLLASGHGEWLIERWRRADVLRLWSALGLPELPAVDGLHQAAEPALDLLAAAWTRAGLSGGTDADARARDRLRLWLALAASSTSSTVTDSALASLVHVLVDLAALVRLDDSLKPLLAMETPLFPAALRRMADGPLADALQWLVPLGASPAGRAIVARAAAVPRRAVGRPAAPHETSEVGGIFLLALGLADLGIWQRWVDQDGEGAARRHLVAVALKALGRERAPLLLGERALATFAGLDETPPADARQPLRADTGPPGWSGVLPALASTWYPPADRDPVMIETDGLVVLRDMAAGHWLAAAPASRITLRPDLRPRQASQEERDTVAAETAHLQLGRRLGYSWLTPSLDAALSVVASLALRRLAARLPGFARAGPAYLARQFLAQPARIERGGEVLTVRLAGGPLAVVLDLADLPERLIVPWLDRPLGLSRGGRPDPGAEGPRG